MENMFAHKLKQLREKSGFSLQQIADMVGVAKQSIHKFETGVMNPSEDTLQKLADAFNIEYSRFYDNLEAFTFNNIRFRNAHQLFDRNGTEDDIQEEVLNYVAKFTQLERIMNISRYFDNPLADFEITDEKDIEKAAKLIRKKWKMGNDPIYDVIAMLEGNGVYVVEVKRPENFLGLSGVFDDQYPIIVLNESTLTVERKRFTALHELGHIVLAFAADFSEEKTEVFCDHFAGAILLLDEVLFYELGKNRTIVSLAELKRIKETYGISVQAIIVRARATGFINYNTYRDWWNTYENWRQRENSTNDFGQFKCTERANRFEALLMQGLTERRISWAKAAELCEQRIDVLKEQLNEIKFSLQN